MADVKLKAVLTLKDKMTSGLESSGKSLNNFKDTANKAGVAITALAGVMLIKGVKNAVEFEKSMTNVRTLIDDDVESFDELKEGVIELGKKTPQPLGDLTEALYDVRSAGVSAEDQFLVLESAAKLATAGLSTTKEATNILTSAINVYGDETHDANKLSDILFKTVKAGKTTVAELAQGFGKTAGIAKETGIEIEDLQASVAILTTGGITASEAYTSLKAGISNILKPTSDATAAAQKLGINFDLSTLQSEGLAGMLQNVAEAAGDDKQAIADLFGSVEAANAIFNLTSDEGLAKMLAIQQDMLDPANALDEAFQKQTETAAAQWEMMKNNLNFILMEFASVVMPVVVGAMEKFINYVTENENVIKNLAIIIGTVATAFVAMKTAMLIKSTITGFIGMLRGLNTMIVTLNSSSVLAAASLGGIVALVGFAAIIAVRQAYSGLQQDIQALHETAERGKNQIVKLDEAIANSDTDEEREKWQRLKTELEKSNDELKEIEDRYRGIQGLWNAMKDYFFGMPTGPFGGGGGGSFAEGGSITGGTANIVGEKGPEIFVPRGSGTIIPNDQIGGAVTVNFNNATVRNDNDLSAIIAAVKQSLNRDLQTEQLGI